jgi:hypothetical protein
MKSRNSFAKSLALAKEGETDNGCWPWPKVGSNGYPTAVKVDGRSVGAHVAVYRREVGEVPLGMSLDHLCHSFSSCLGGTSCLHRRCVRPDHLEPVTPLEQQERRPDRGYCHNGHELTVDNFSWQLDGDAKRYRKCRTCGRESSQRYRDRLRVLARELTVEL